MFYKKNKKDEKSYKIMKNKTIEFVIKEKIDTVE
jgi:hypothetical protein